MSQLSNQIDNTDLLENFISAMEGLTFDELEDENSEYFQIKDSTRGLVIIEHGLFKADIEGTESNYDESISLFLTVNSFEFRIVTREVSYQGSVEIFISPAKSDQKQAPDSTTAALRFLLWAVTHIEDVENHINLTPTVFNKIKKIHHKLYKAAHMEKVDTETLPQLTHIFISQQISKKDFHWLATEQKNKSSKTKSHKQIMTLPKSTPCLRKRIANPQVRQLKVDDSIDSDYSHYRTNQNNDPSYFEVLYQFSDDSVVAADEILYHNNSIKINPKFLPAGPDLLKNIDTFWPEGSFWKTLPKRRKPFAELAIRILTAGKPPAPVSLALHADTDKQLVFKIQKLGFMHSSNIPAPTPIKGPLKSKLLKPQSRTLCHKLTRAPKKKKGKKSNGLAISSLELSPQNESEFYCEDFIFQPEKGHLYFHPFRTAYSQMENIVSAHFGFDQYKKHSSDPQICNPERVQFTVYGSSDISKLNQKLIAGPNPLVDQVTIDPPLTIIAKQELSGQVYFFKCQLKYCLSFQHNDKTHNLWNFSKEFSPLLSILNDGLGAVLNDHHPYSTKRRRRSERAINDRTLLKHKGASHLILLKMLQQIVEAPRFSSKKQRNSFFKTLYNETAILLRAPKKASLKTEDEEELSLKKMCSRDTISQIERLFDHLENLYHSPAFIFSTEEFFQLEGGNKTLFQILLSFLAELAAKTKGNLFLRPSKAYFNAGAALPGKDSNTPYLPLSEEASFCQAYKINESMPKEACQYQLISDKTAEEFPIQPWINLISEKGLQVFVENQPLSLLSSEIFQSQFDVQSKNTGPIDWFALNPKFFFNGQEVSLDKIHRTDQGMIEHDGHYYIIPTNKNLPSVRALNWFWERISKGSGPSRDQRAEDSIYQIPKSQSLELLALRAAGVPVIGGKSWQEICDFYDRLDQPRTKLRLGTSFKGQLKPYQDLGVQWLLDLYKLKLGGILADDMGLGKTIQTLAFLEVLRKKDQLGHCLVVVPTSLTYNWLSEAEKFTPEMSVVRFLSKDKDYVAQLLNEKQNLVVLVSYGLFCENESFLDQYKWNIHIYDEAHNLKNIKTKRTTVARKISAQFKICLTGTPLENHYDELYSQMDLVVPGCLGKHSDFLTRFVRPTTVDQEDLQLLKLKMKPLILRRSKQQILKELPAKIESLLKIPFETSQKKIYRNIAVSWNEKVMKVIDTKGEAQSQIMMLTALLRLRQACSDPAAIPGVKYQKLPPKLDTLMTSLEKIIQGGESALVFTQFIHTFKHIEKLLLKQNIPYYSMHGQLTPKRREKNLFEFNNHSGGAVFLMTLKTGGVGLNLTKANYVFHLEPWWNPAVENQATDRTHRLGQKKAITVYRYIIQDSIEEKVELLKGRKAARFGTLFSDDENTDIKNSTNQRQLNKSDFDELIS